MADTSGDNSQEPNEDADKKKKNILEEKSKDDLIKLVKKYLNLLQKSKNKTDELNEKCSFLEQEQSILTQAHQSTIKGLQNRIEEQEHEILELKAEKVLLKDKFQENDDLKQKLKDAIEEKKSQAPFLRESEEQLQCLNLQLQSLKASCQCIQEENVKLQKSNKEKLEEINLLVKKHEALSFDFNKKLEECDLLLKIKENVEVKYETIIEKKHFLQDRMEKLISENENLQKNNNELDCKIQNLEKCKNDFEKSDCGIMLGDLQKLQDENEMLMKQLKRKSKSSNEKLQGDSEAVVESKIAHSHLEQEKLTLEEKNKALQLELDICNSKILELEREIKNVVYSSQVSDYTAGIELALLQGASTEDLIYPTDPKHSKSPISKSKDSNFREENSTALKGESYSSGLEFALLAGGDTSPSDVCGAYMPCSEVANSELELNYDNTTTPDYALLLEECKIEKRSLVRKLEEYSSLCRDTIDENNKLKIELNNLKSKNAKASYDKETSTESEWLKHADATKELDISTEEEKIENSLFSENHFCSNCNHFCSEIMSFYQKIQSEEKFDSRQQIFKGDYLDLLKNIKKMYAETASDLERKKSDLNEYNLQLELLVIGVKQGVRQKTSVSSYLAENSLEENMNALKLLLDDLVSRSSCSDSKLKMVQSQAMSKVYELEDQLSQLKELNQFLEDENSELRSEIEKLKSSPSDSANHCNEYTREDYQQNTELYSIDESNEFDDKFDPNSNIKPEKETSNSYNIIMQTSHPSLQDSYIQTEAEFHSEVKDISKISEDVGIQTDFIMEDYEKQNKQLIIENESLQEVLNEKCNLVENIHCQLDSHLTKIEELTFELQNREDDLKHTKIVNANLEKMVTKAESIRGQEISNLKNIEILISDCKTKHSDLSEDVKFLILSFKDLIANVNNDTLNVINQYCKNIDNLTNLCNHKENNMIVIKKWICDFANDFESWLNLIDQMIPDSLPNMSELVRTTRDPVSNEPLFDKICSETCCCIIENICNLNSYKQKLFSSLYNHLNNNYSQLVTDLHNCWTRISELEEKATACTCKNNSDMQTVTDSVDENLLKNTLADTEIKMNKIKQLAVKLKKELSLAKEQNTETVLEKEKLQKQNTKLLDELNKTSEDQCKYVQNFQTLQNEFDKLQDNCEMDKINMKKLEDDLAIKLNEVNSTKEQILELEHQLKSSKHLLETNVSSKKELEAKYADLEGKIIVLESKIDEKDRKIISVEMDIAKHLKDFNTAQEDNKLLKDQLELALKEGNKKSLLDLEMADYERSITELNNKMKKKDDEIEDLQSEIQALKERNDCLQEELKATETLKETESKRSENLKDILEKTKSELNEVKEHEAELQSKTASLEVQLETLIQQEENYKIQLSEASAQIQHLQDIIKTSSENHQRIVRSLEQKISSQKEEIYLTHKEVESVKQEFENYKIRVHSVLKQQKSVIPAITTVDADIKEKLETVNEKLKLQVKDLSEKLTAISLEYDTLQEDHNNLLKRYDKVIEEREQKDKEWHQRLELLNAEKSRLRATQEELSSQHLLQNEMLVATYKKQIKIMSDEHKKIVNDLQKQLDAADVEISRLQRDHQKLQGLPVAPSPQDSSTSLDLLSQERQEGEGSENTDDATTPIRHLSLTTIPTSGFLPFEKLIQSPIEPGTPVSYVSNYDSEKLTTDLNAANKKIDHLSELLNDSESTNLRLSEQVRVLKDEVRRLENNKDRQQHAENLEYLKNVFIKFATLQPGSEKAMLIPVLTTMLKLSSQEQQQLKSIAGDTLSDDNMNAGWGSYLHRWSGLS